MQIQTHRPKKLVRRAPAPAQTSLSSSDVPFDTRGGVAAGAVGLVVSRGGAMFAAGSPLTGYGMGAFIGGVTGMQMAEAMDKPKAAGALLGAATGAGMVAAGLHGGWPGALGVAAGAFLLRGMAPKLLA